MNIDIRHCKCPGCGIEVPECNCDDCKKMFSDSDYKYHLACDECDRILQIAGFGEGRTVRLLTEEEEAALPSTELQRIWRQHEVTKGWYRMETIFG